ncbi:RNA-directed DNA polymerase (reverse transcriptase)-related family protein [Rhynchospora pubera]|uniref:RNA-directed DNA polymerase (Reverse transcriptase)-related family protein n=1 Tax=Rhynchospora pubera TaxID=906938 RepID=A0AAV8BYW0_9POAL|nr:RNA-directed DNA polymerase (reverse transcriptase)-related family protein [Rhynchospora pubera]
MPQFQDLVRNFWFSNRFADTPLAFGEKLDLLTREIRQWALGRTSSVKRQVQVITKFLSKCDKQMEIRPLTELEKVLKMLLKRRFVTLAELEEEIWKQRSAIKWRLEGDKNTAFFHAVATNNKRKNQIQKLMVDEVELTDQKSKGRAFFTFFCSLMGSGSEQLPITHWNSFFDLPQHELFSDLHRPITTQEVISAIDSWPCNRSPGPDGYTGDFFKAFKEELVPEITATLNSALSLSSLSPLNSSIIALIPKTEGANQVKDFRPISIIHSMQRILSKILTVRFTPIFERLTSQNQTGFIRGRSITENFLSAQELIYFAQRTRTPMAIFKADIHKAFDTLSWEFTEHVLKALGFPSICVSWILNCVLRGTSRVIVNGIAGKPITLKRGVRQGDPISPYIFITAFDFLSKWISRLAQDGIFKVPKPGVYPSLFYADDTIIFFKPTQSQAVLLKLILTIFGHLSGLNLNPLKSDLVTVNTSSTVTQRLVSVLGCNSAHFPIKYLGLPLSNKKLNKNAYNDLLQRFQKKLMGWQANFFSVAGRLVLLNSCLSSLPVYFMSVFKVPSSILQTIDKLRRTFLWHGSQSQGKKLVMISWDLVTRPKQCGGLGVLDLKAFNLALLSKWLWKWLNPNDSLWKSQLNALYPQQPAIFPNSTVIQKSLIEASFIFQTGLTFTVGNGKSILFWHHNWGFGILKFRFQGLFSFALDSLITLGAFMDTIINPLPLFSHLLPYSTAATSQLQKITNILNSLRISNQNLPSTTLDKPFWKLEGASGTFSTSSTYQFIKSNPTYYSNIFKIWSFKIPPRFKIFIWRMLHNKLATLDNLQRRGWYLPNRCILCCNSSETILHIFSQCRFYLQLRSLVHNDSTLSAFTADTLFPQNPMALVEVMGVPSRAKDLWATVFFILWRERCTRIFSERSKQPQALLQEILSECHSLHQQHN